MKYDRASGILLHPTSLPGDYGIGDLGPSAFRWIDFLVESDCQLWQILPLGPTGYGDSPYQCFSAFAGNPYLISPEKLMQEGMLTEEEIGSRPDFSPDAVDYGKVIPWKLAILDLAYGHFISEAPPELKQEYKNFVNDQSFWLPDFALFMAIKDAHGGAPWVEWEPQLRDRDARALEAAREEHKLTIESHTFRQFIFWRQWTALRAYAQNFGIKIIGDIPIFVAHDSADVWSNKELFFLDKKGHPKVVAGVPPDYFSADGQLWGNPLYRWKAHKKQKYEWWLGRLGAVLNFVDIVRVDHFRGFAANWEIPAAASTAKKGRWVKGPGEHFFLSVQKALGELPIIAEDLGVITPDVIELRKKFNLPGMKVILFGFMGGPKDPFIPHNYSKNYVVYTGTHDNDTILGWYKRVDETEKDFYRRYLARDGSDVSWDLIRACWASVCMFALAPMQDFLGLDNSARMNYPGKPSGNWIWRMSATAMDASLAKRIKELNYLYARAPHIPDTVTPWSNDPSLE